MRGSRLRAAPPDARRRRVPTPRGCAARHGRASRRKGSCEWTWKPNARHGAPRKAAILVAARPAWAASGRGMWSRRLVVVAKTDLAGVRGRVAGLARVARADAVEVGLDVAGHAHVVAQPDLAPAEVDVRKPDRHV